MLEIIEINTHHPSYPFMEGLMETSFPLEERRDTDLQRQYTDENPLFHNHLITFNQVPIGLISYWKLEDVIYIEHFAIDPNLRNGGYGKQVIEKLKEQTQIPLILEAEEPTDELAQRRIGFYQRNGFTLQDLPYLQPPYRKGNDWFPLKIMTYGRSFTKEELEKYKTLIYREVYKVI